MALSEHAKKELEAPAEWLKKKCIVTSWIFPDRDGDRVDPNHIYEQWYVYRTQHGIKCNLHEMRHTLISVAQSDVPERLLKRIVGHSKSFGIYGHDVDGELQRGANLINGVFDRLLNEVGTEVGTEEKEKP